MPTHKFTYHRDGESHEAEVYDEGMPGIVEISWVDASGVRQTRYLPEEIMFGLIDETLRQNLDAIAELIRNAGKI